MREDMTIPVVRIELERMQRTICAAIMEETARMDEQIREAVKAACDPQSIKRLLRQHADQVLSEAIQQTLRNHFMHGPGQETLKAHIVKMLESQRFE